MAKFSYTAEKPGGEVYTGVAEAKDRFELYQIIKREGGKVLGFSNAGVGSRLSMEYWNIKLSRVSEQQKIVFARNLGSMMTAGLSLSRALAVLERQAGSPRLRQTISQIGGDVRRGATLHAALEKFPTAFSKLMVAMVRAGEEGGDLAGVLKLAADQMERAHTLKKKIRGAMFYPAVVLVAIFIIGGLMMMYVVPTLAATFESMNAELPLSTRIIIGISDALTHHTTLALALIAAAAVLLYTAAKSERAKIVTDWIFLRLPAIGGMVRETNAARTARTLASLIASGVDMLSALDITRDIVQNVYFRSVIDEARNSVAAGNPLSAAFLKHEQLYPAFVGEMMSVGEETGQTAEMLRSLAAYYEEDVDRQTRDLSTIIEPLLILFIGGAVGFFAVSMIAPIYQITQNIH